MEIEIVKGNNKDLESITFLNQIIFGGTKTAKEIEEKLSLSSYQNPHITLGKINGKLGGYAIGYSEKRKDYHLWMLGVLPEYRKNGMGSKILEEQINFAKNNNYSKLFIKTSNKWRDMLKLSISRGFNISGFKTNEWGSNPAIWLELNLKE
ncbi:MAG: GNAT family N-acetyltransferase [Candidatus Nanoarchaeia archaeon]